jgi:nucleoid-associated protein YgaU
MGLLDKVFDNDKNDDKNRKPADFSDVRSNAPKSGANFDDVRGSVSSAPTSGTASSRTYTVVAGDSLSKIAKREFGDANKWKAIYEANRDTIKNPDLIHPGQVLTLPPNA